mmetsp:Transcript_19876/g.33452  ORF Transcript_19876/g.33452 Transcript_19876/m.33452 type:complete len:165 (-) Transcript_19876:177-671(-)
MHSDDTSELEWMWVFHYVQKCLRGGAVTKRLYHTSPALLKSHLVAEGVDFHCDSKLVDYLLAMIKDSRSGDSIGTEVSKWHKATAEKGIAVEITDALKTTIWHFRSAVNHRAAWVEVLSPGERHHYHSNRKHAAVVKAQHAMLWRVICPLVKAYCSQKLTRIYS